MKEDTSYYLYVYYVHSKSADCDPLRPPPVVSYLFRPLAKVICPDAGVGTVGKPGGRTGPSDKNAIMTWRGWGWGGGFRCQPQGFAGLI